MKLNQISDRPGARQARKRVGRGIGSGTGKTSGAGHKGQKSRSGVSIKGFEGGQMPLHRRMPKRGFNNIFGKTYRPINVGRLQQAVDAGRLDPQQPIDAAALRMAGLIKQPRDGVRLLAKGSLKAKINIVVAGASKAAVEAVEKAGGSVTIASAAPKPSDKPAAKSKGAPDAEPAAD